MMSSRNLPGAREGDRLSPAQFDWFRDLIEDRCGLHFDERQRVSLELAVRARLHELGLRQVDDYALRLRARTDDEEFRKLINLVTVTSTSFFRDPAQFRLLRHFVLPTLLAARRRAGKRMLRIWSAGCSSGEEAYSIALILRDMDVYRAYPDWTFEIVGTDLNTDALERARRGVYDVGSLRNVEGEWLRRYFTPQGSQFRLTDEIRRAVRFEYGNLAEADPPRSWAGTRDIVFCKNVTIYFQPAATRRLVRAFRHVLVEDGYLLLGHSETLWQIADGFELVADRGAFCYRKTSAAARPALPSGSGRPPAAASRAAPSGARASLPVPEVRDDARAGRYARCLAAFRAGDWAQAEGLLQALIATAPTFVPAHLLLAGVHLHAGRYDQAVERAEAVLRLNDLDARAHLLVGIAAARQGRPGEAVQALRRALYLDDSLALAHFWIGNLHRDRGERARACRDYENILEHWERHTLELTEEFALGMTAGELVAYCRESVVRLEPVR